MLCSYKCSCVFLYSSHHSGNPLSVEISLDFKHYHVSPEGFPGALVVLLSVIRKDFINIYSRSWLIITWSVTMVSFFFLSTTSINSIDPQHYWVYIKCSVFINYSLPTYEYLQHLSLRKLHTFLLISAFYDIERQKLLTILILLKLMSSFWTQYKTEESIQIVTQNIFPIFCVITYIIFYF